MPQAQEGFCIQSVPSVRLAAPIDKLSGLPLIRAAGLRNRRGRCRRRHRGGGRRGAKVWGAGGAGTACVAEPAGPDSNTVVSPGPVAALPEECRPGPAHRPAGDNKPPPAPRIPGTGTDSRNKDYSRGGGNSRAGRRRAHPRRCRFSLPRASTGDDTANAAKKAATDKAIFIFMASSPVMASFGL